ncbi:hypothetical protein AOLI_G00201230 [Acnodon oligacanthus]
MRSDVTINYLPIKAQEAGLVTIQSKRAQAHTHTRTDGWLTLPLQEGWKLRFPASEAKESTNRQTEPRQPDEGMEFPVDMLVSVTHEELERSAHSYMSELLYSDPEHGQYFTLTSGRKIRISLSNVGFVPLYGANLMHKVLALFAPEDQFTAVALFLDDQWYAVDDILRTADPSREGLIEVRSVAERIVLYVLNRIVYRTNEMSSGEVPFLCHGETDYVKILWKSGEAVGFYSVKPRGSLCNNFVSQCYLLPVMDSIFVRKSHRGNEHGLQMLEDYVDSFKDDELGLKYPLSPAMSRVCRHYLNRYPADVDLLWEVEGVGGPYQKTRVASKLSSHALRGGLLSWEKDDGKNGQTVEDKVEMTEETSLDITEEIIVVNKHLKVAEETHDTPISTRTRSSEHKRKKRIREEKEMSAAESQPEKVCRVEEQETEAVAQEEEGEKIGQEVAESAPEPADETEEQVAPEAPTVEQEPKEQVMEVNGELTEEPGAEHNTEEAQGSIEAEAVLQNGTVGEDEEEMDVDEAAEEQDPIDSVDCLEEAAVEELKEVDEENLEGEVDTVANEHQEEDSSAAEEQEVSPAAEEEGLAEDKLLEEAPQAAGAEEKEEKEVNPSAEVAPDAEEKQEVAPDAEEKQEVAPDAEEKQEVAPDAEEKQEVAPDAEEKQEVAPDAEEKQEVAPDAEEKQEVAPDAEEKQEKEVDPSAEVACEAEEKQEVAPDAEEKQEVAPDAEEKQEKEVDPSAEAPPDAEEEQEAPPDAEEEQEAPPDAEEEQEAPPDAEEEQEAPPDAEEEQEAPPDAEEEQEAPPEAEEVNKPMLAPTGESSEEATGAPSEGQQRQEEPMEIAPVEQYGVREASTEPPKEEESKPEAEIEDENMDRLELEEEEEVQKKEQGGDEESTVAMTEDECRGEGEEKSSDESPESSAPVVHFLRGGRTKAVPPTPKRSSKRLTRKEDKVTIEEGKMTIDEENVPAEEEKVTTEEEKVTTEEEVEHSSEGEEAREEPPVIDRRVLRQKIKTIRGNS